MGINAHHIVKRLFWAVAVICLSVSMTACASKVEPTARAISAKDLAELNATPVPSTTPLRAPTSTPVAPPMLAATTMSLPAAPASPTLPPSVVIATLPAIIETPSERYATVIEVIDGDTMVVESSEGRAEISYWGCSVPDDASDWQREQCASANRVLLSVDEVRLEPDPLAEIMGVPRYYIWAGDTLLNAEMVRMGYARADELVAGSRYEQDITESQALAKSAGLGIWAPTPAATRVNVSPTPGPETTQEPNDPTPTSLPTTTPYPSDTPWPTDTPLGEPTDWPTDAPAPPTATPVPTATDESPGAAPSDIPASTNTPAPTNTPPPTQTQEPSPPDVQSGDVIITDVFYDGVQGRAEPDEYCEITNEGDARADMEGWRLNAGANGQDFVFGMFVLDPGQVCRVYTNEIHDEWGGLAFGSGSALWKNSGDCGYLYDADGVERHSYCYD